MPLSPLQNNAWQHFFWLQAVLKTRALKTHRRNLKRTSLFSEQGTVYDFLARVVRRQLIENFVDVVRYFACIMDFLVAAAITISMFSTRLQNKFYTVETTKNNFQQWCDLLQNDFKLLTAWWKFRHSLRRCESIKRVQALGTSSWNMSVISNTYQELLYNKWGDWYILRQNIFDRSIL